MKIIRDNRIYVKAHEWASSLRTLNYPIYGIKKDGDMYYIGGTVKRPTAYPLEPDTIAVVRLYVSNNGYRTFYLYPLWIAKEGEDVREIPIMEIDNYKIQQWHLEGLEEEDVKIVQGLRKRILDFFKVDFEED